MKPIVAALIMVFPLVGGACAGGLGGMGGGCGMGGHSGHGGGSHESHTPQATTPASTQPAPDPAFDAERTRRMLEAYERIVVALAADKIAGVEDAAATIVSEAPNDVIKSTATPLTRSDSKPKIEDVRVRFKPLSEAVVQYVSDNHEALASALEKGGMPRTAYCPMVETAWLQHGDKITNPFYGASMLRCGEFREF